MIKKYKHKIKTNKFYNSLFKNSFWAFLGDSSASVLNLIITILLIRFIGNNDYGILVLAQSYMSINDVILNVQSWKGVIQYGQKSLVEKDDEKFNGYIKLGISIDFLTAIFGGIISIVIAPLIGSIFGWSQIMIACCRIFSITIFFHLSGTPTALLRILNKFYLVALQKILTSLIKLISLIIFLKYRNLSLTQVVLAYCCADIFGNILLMIFAGLVYLKKYKLKNLLRAKIPIEKNKFISFTLWSTLGDIVDIPVNYLDVFIISVLGTEMVSIFKVFKQIASILKKITAPIQQAIMPQFSELNAKNNRERGYNMVLKIRNVVLSVLMPISIIAGLSSPIWLKLIFSKVYAENWLVFFIYLIAQVIALSYATIHSYFITLNKAKEDTLYTMISNIVYLLFIYVFIKLLGLFGVVLGFAIQAFLCIYLKKLKIQEVLKE